MASDSPLPIRLAQTLGITTSLIFAGVNASLSIFLIPRILESPTPLLLKQWSRMYEAGKAVGRPAGAIAALSFFYLSYHHHTTSVSSFVDNSQAWGYLTAGLLSIGIVPYTILVIMPTNNKLLKKADETRALEKEDHVVKVGLGEETAHQLADWWGVLNLGRGVMLTASGVLGLWLALN
jgi:hypothetical protein